MAIHSFIQQTLLEHLFRDRKVRSYRPLEGTVMGEWEYATCPGEDAHLLVYKLYFSTAKHGDTDSGLEWKQKAQETMQ